MNAARNTLIRARALIEQGWCQHRSRCSIEGNVQHCMLGALDSVAHGLTEREGAKSALLSVIPAQALYPFGSITAWNDAFGRTKSEVLDKYDEAINSLREEPLEPITRA